MKFEVIAMEKYFGVFLVNTRGRRLVTNPTLNKSEAVWIADDLNKFAFAEKI